MQRTSPRLGALSLVIALVACGAPPNTNVPKVDVGPARAADDIAHFEKSAVPEDDAVVPVEADDATWGSRVAPVTIVQFSDFECPFCARAEITMDELKRVYGPEKLRVVFKHYPLPFHPHARDAAEASAGVLALAGNKGFWTFHGLAFTAQTDLGAAAYEGWAAQAGANVTALRAGLEHHTWADKVKRDEATAKKLGVQGTPHFYVNGTAIGGAQPLENFKTVIDAELARAQEKLAQGTPRDRLYRAMAEANYKKPEPDKDDDDDVVSTDVFKVPVGASPVRGDKAALVTIVEFSDFQCPYCKRVEGTLKSVLAAYPKDAVRLVWKNEPLPFHKRAEPAAELALEARAQKGDAGFWDAHDRIFAEAQLEDADLMRVAAAAGLDAKKVTAALATRKWQRTIDDDSDLADEVQASGTPHFFINGRRLVGAQPEEKFKALIDEELAKAKAQVAQGTAAAKLYDAIIANGKTFPPAAIERRPMPDAKGFASRGAANAPITIVEFSDFECPFCKTADGTMDELIKAYPGKVRVVWRNFPLPMHGHARLAAETALEARAQKGDAGFQKMREALFLHSDHLERADLEGYAQQQGLDVGKLKASLDGRTYAAAIDADMDAAKAAKIDGVPAFFVIGYYISGAQQLRKFRKVVDAALKDAAGGAKP